MTGLVWRLAWREWRAGDLAVLMSAVAVAVAALMSVALLSDRVNSALARQASELLAADLSLNSDRPPSSARLTALRGLGLDVGQSASLPSMAFASAGGRLVNLKAVSANWPLRGEVTLATAAGEQRGRLAPARGTVWADARLLAALGVRTGDRLTLGEREFVIAAELVREPDGVLDLYNFVPRVVMPMDDLAATGLAGEGARVRWRLLAAGEPAQVTSAASLLRPQLARGERLEDIREARPELRVALERAGRFLGLTALATVGLAAAAVALAARHWLGRHTRMAAVLATLGATRRLRLAVFAGQLLLAAGAAALLGALAGGMAQMWLAARLAAWAGVTLPAAAWPVWLLAPALGLVLVLGLTAPYLLALTRTPALAVLREDVQQTPAGWAVAGVALACLMLLAWPLIGDATLAWVGMAGFAGFALVVAVLVRLALAGLARLPSRGVGVGFGLRLLARRPWLAGLQAMALAVGGMALLTVALVRGDLLDAWRGQLPADAPNRFAINIQPAQVGPLSAMFRELALPVPEFAPMYRARLTAIGDRPVVPEQYPDQRARHLAEREFNLSWRAALPPANRVTDGRFWSGGGQEAAFSVEAGLARTLGIRVGDTLSFDLAGRTVRAPVTSLREVRWDSFRVNFFVLASPGLLAGEPASLVSSFYLPPDRLVAFEQALARFPGVTVVDVTALLNEVRQLTDRLAQAVEFLFGFTLAAGLVTLVAATVATQAERARDAALLRTLGATRRQLLAVLLGEFLWLGMLAGVLAALGAGALGWAVGFWVLDLTLLPSPWLLLAGVGLCGLAALLAGGWAVRRVLSEPPAARLRALSAV